MSESCSPRQPPGREEQHPFTAGDGEVVPRRRYGECTRGEGPGLRQSKRLGCEGFISFHAILICHTRHEHDASTTTASSAPTPTDATRANDATFFLRTFSLYRSLAEVCSYSAVPC